MRSTVGRILLGLGFTALVTGCATLGGSGQTAEKSQGKSPAESLSGKAPAGKSAAAIAADLVRVFHWKTAVVSVTPLTEPLIDAEAREARLQPAQAPVRPVSSVSARAASAAKTPLVPRASCFRFEVRSSDSADTAWFQASYILVTDFKGKCQKVAFVTPSQGCVPLKVDFSRAFKMELDPKYQKDLSKQTLSWD